MVKILLVDNSGIYSDITKKALIAFGPYEVVTANTLQEGIESLDKGNFDLLVTGWMFPGENAAGLAEQFLDTGKPVIINTSFRPGEETQLDGFVENHLLVKRIKTKGDTTELLEKIKNCLEPIDLKEGVNHNPRIEG